MNLATDDTGGRGLIGLAEDVFDFGKRQPTAEGATGTAEILTAAEPVASKPAGTTAQVPRESPRPPDSFKPLLPRKELKTASALAQAIERDLAQHPECPKNGFRVTVYGATRWRAMLTITTAAGRVRDPRQWRDLTDELADRLRQRYDLAWE